MKRIDDKIKEIEKKDKTNRIIFIIVLILVAAWYVWVTQKTITEQKSTIEVQDVTIEEQLEIIKAKNDSLQGVVEKLRESLTPEGYWSDVQAAGTTQAYLEYLTQDRISIYNLDEALENITKSSTKGRTAWLFAGRMNGDEMNEDDVLDILMRKGAEEENYAQSKPQVGDIVLNNTQNRNVYRRYSNGQTSNQLSGGWPRGVKAMVMKVETAGTAVFVQIKF